MQTPYQTPEEAVNGLIDAYRSLDVERIVETKDFNLDSRVFWQNLGLPVSAEQLVESRDAFETNFRKEMENGIPDYRSVSFKVISQETLGDNNTVITLAGETTEKQTFQIRLATIRTANGWKVVRVPGYDHL